MSSSWPSAVAGEFASSVATTMIANSTNAIADAKPDPPPAEAFLVHEHHHAVGAVQRPALRHHVRLGEELKVADHRRHADEEETSAQQRQLDVPERLPGARAVDPRGVVQFLAECSAARP